MKVFVWCVGRLTYMALGALVAVIILYHHFSGFETVGDILLPNVLPEMVEECIDYYTAEEMHYGQICYFEDGYIYLFLPWDEYFNTHIIGCTVILEHLLMSPRFNGKDELETGG